VITARVSALFELGQHELAIAELQHAVHEARATDNVGALLLLSTQVTRVDIMTDHPERSMPRLEAEYAQLPPQRFGLLHAYYVAAVMRVGCATGHHDWALQWAQAEFERLERSVLKRGGPFAAITPALHARLLLNRSVARGESAAQARATIARDLRSMASGRAPGADGVLARTHARLALIAGDRAEARKQLEYSFATFQRFSLTDETARERFALGALIAGDEGRAMQAEALAALRAHGWVNPHNDLRAYYPELIER
jgi:hypothetical protein